MTTSTIVVAEKVDILNIT